MDRNARIAVLMGGPSVEHEVSLESGKAMLRALQEAGYHNAFPVVVSQARMYTRDGDRVSARGAFSGADVVLLGVHGEWGEDGRAQALLEWLGIPYNGSRVFSSALAMDKERSRQVFREQNLRIPNGHIYSRLQTSADLEGLARTIVLSRHLPAVVKPVARGSSVGISLVRHPTEMSDALRKAFQFDDRVLVEDYQHGAEVSCGVLEDARCRIRALPVVQIIPPASKPLFDYEAKYSGMTQELVPAPQTKAVTRRIQDAALEAHKALGCRHYSRVDIMLVNGQPVVLEVNTLPGMTPESIFPKEAAAAGIPFPDLIAHFVKLGLRNRA